VSGNIFHITSNQELNTAKNTNVYVPVGFETDGFIHCSYAHQVVEVLHRFYSDASDLVILEIEPLKLSCSVIAENLEGGTELFPHIYGVLPLEAVVRVHRISKNDSGQWHLPSKFI
jgi:uncharacterized protein (DUF952 family)